MELQGVYTGFCQFCGIRHKELLPPIDVRVDSVLNCEVVEFEKVSADEAIESQLR